MRKLKKIYLVGGNIYLDYLNWILPLGFEVTKDLDKSTHVFFSGGSDLSSYLYGEKEGSYLGTNPQRDKEELDIFKRSGDRIKLAVCRGGQMLTVANGYRLVQHMSHPGTHDTYTIDGQVLESSSSHHNQFLLYPNNLIEPSPFTLIGWAKKLSPFHLDGNDIDYNFPKDYKEPEIVLYDGTELGRGKSWSIQMHPEWLSLNHPTVKYLQNFLLKNLM